MGLHPVTLRATAYAGGFGADGSGMWPACAGGGGISDVRAGK